MAEKREKASGELVLEAIPERFSICKVTDYGSIDLDQPFCFTGRTDAEKSLVCPMDLVPGNTVSRDDGWRALRITGELDFSLTGILAGIAAILAARGIGIFAISTYQTDYILTKEEDFDQALTVLKHAGYGVKNPDSEGTDGIRLTSDSLSVLIYPERGGKLASIRDRHSLFELLYQPRRNYPPLRPGMPFSEGDASGFDDVFPSMGETWHPSFQDAGIQLPDHGEIWTARMTVDAVCGDRVRMHTFGKAFPYRYDKEILLRENRVLEKITVTNQGAAAFPALWVCHCLLKMEPESRFEFPERSERIECSPRCPWPPAGEIPGMLSDLQPMPPEGSMMKFYFRDPVKKGECAVIYPRAGMRAVMRFSPEQLPYLGFWITNGGYRGEVNFAFEPASGYFDTLQKAAETGVLPMLQPGESKTYEIEIEVDALNPTEYRS